LRVTYILDDLAEKVEQEKQKSYDQGYDDATDML